MGPGVSFSWKSEHLIPSPPLVPQLPGPETRFQFQPAQPARQGFNNRRMSLLAMTVASWRCEGAIRFGLGRITSREESEFSASSIANAVHEVSHLLNRH